jgi:hypothetical protein
MTFSFNVRNTRTRDEYSRRLAKEKCCYNPRRAREAWTGASIADVNEVDRHASLRLPSASKAVPHRWLGEPCET